MDLFEQVAKFFSNFGGGIAGEDGGEEPFRVAQGAAFQGEGGGTAVNDRTSGLQGPVGRHKIRRVALVLEGLEQALPGERWLPLRPGHGRIIGQTHRFPFEPRAFK